MNKLVMNPNNKKYYSEEYIKGWEDGVKAQYEARPKGEWVFDEDEGEYVCSECKRLAEIETITGEWILPRYCGDCGAYMVNYSTVYER